MKAADADFGYTQYAYGFSVPDAWPVPASVPAAVLPTLAPTAEPSPPTTPKPTPVPVPSISYDLYTFTTAPTTLPDYAALTPNYTSLVNTIDFANTATQFPGPPDSGNVAPNLFFAVRLAALLKVPTAGTYGFFMKNDDGARLLLNNVAVITQSEFFSSRMCCRPEYLHKAMHISYEIPCFLSTRLLIALL